MQYSVEIIINFMSETSLTIWELLSKEHSSLLSSEIESDFIGEKCTAREINRKIQRYANPYFIVGVGDGEIVYGNNRSKQHSLVWIKQLVSDLGDAEKWVMPFVDLDSFVQARTYDLEYEYWQNANSPIDFTAKGRSSAGLPMKSNGLPYPLEEQIIDISGNPGRRQTRMGYVECVGAVMWLGVEFLNRTGLSEEVVFSTDWLNARKVNDRVIRIQVFDEPFTTADGEQGRLQNELRSLLFPKIEA
ncbi:MAG: hypothetical protein HYV27_04230 [Candidatus Hydrogenedentes bacterium]|nr:hypothetical protein [Candidatus Hydrogenedentota bacterium]